jgi:hypothetical protein
MNEVKNSLETGDNVYLRGTVSCIKKQQLKYKYSFKQMKQSKILINHKIDTMPSGKKEREIR